jgi:hypothetical protein
VSVAVRAFENETFLFHYLFDVHFCLEHFFLKQKETSENAVTALLPPMNRGLK